MINIKSLNIHHTENFQRLDFLSIPSTLQSRTSMEAIPLWLLPEHFWQSVAVLRPRGLAGQPRSSREHLGKAAHCAFILSMIQENTKITQTYRIPAYESCLNHPFSSSQMAESLHRAAKFARYMSPKRKIAASPGRSHSQWHSSHVIQVRESIGKANMTHHGTP